MNASRTVLGLEPAKLSTLVISTRSMLVLLRADEIVKPPMRSMIVGENIMEKTHLWVDVSMEHNSNNRISSLGCIFRVHPDTLTLILPNDLENDQQERDKHRRDE